MNVRSIGLLTLLIGLCAPSADVHARIYKTVDEDGNVVFTDVPPKDESKAIEIDAGNVYKAPTPPAAAQPAGTTAQDSEEPAEESEVSYDTLRITSPLDDTPVRENAGNITIAVSVNPGLDTNSGHSLEILMDGNVAASGAATNVALTNVDRGTHSVSAQIVNADGEVLISARPITFHMLRASVLTRPAPPAN